MKTSTKQNVLTLIVGLIWGALILATAGCSSEQSCRHYHSDYSGSGRFSHVSSLGKCN